MLSVTDKRPNVRAWTEQLDYQNRGTASELITETQQAKYERTGILQHRAINNLHHHDMTSLNSQTDIYTALQAADTSCTPRWHNVLYK